MAFKVMSHELYHFLPFLIVWSLFFFIKYKINAVAALVTDLSGHHGPLGFYSVSLSLSAIESFALTFVFIYCNIYEEDLKRWVQLGKCRANAALGGCVILIAPTFLLRLSLIKDISQFLLLLINDISQYASSRAFLSQNTWSLCPRNF